MLVRMIRVRMRRLLSDLTFETQTPQDPRANPVRWLPELCLPGLGLVGIVEPDRPGRAGLPTPSHALSVFTIQAVFRLVQQDVHTGSRTKSPRGNLNDVQVALQLIKVTLKVEAVGNVLVIGGSRTGLGQLLEISLARPC